MMVADVVDTLDSSIWNGGPEVWKTAGPGVWKDDTWNVSINVTRVLKDGDHAPPHTGVYGGEFSGGMLRNDGWSAIVDQHHPVWETSTDACLNSSFCFGAVPQGAATVRYVEGTALDDMSRKDERDTPNAVGSGTRSVNELRSVLVGARQPLRNGIRRLSPKKATPDNGRCNVVVDAHVDGGVNWLQDYCSIPGEPMVHMKHSHDVSLQSGWSRAPMDKTAESAVNSFPGMRGDPLGEMVPGFFLCSMALKEGVDYSRHCTGGADGGVQPRSVNATSALSLGGWANASIQGTGTGEPEAQRKCLPKDTVDSVYETGAEVRDTRLKAGTEVALAGPPMTSDLQHVAREPTDHLKRSKDRGKGTAMLSGMSTGPLVVAVVNGQLSLDSHAVGSNFSDVYVKPRTILSMPKDGKLNSIHELDSGVEWMHMTSGVDRLEGLPGLARGMS